jgi:hypothetical protein
MIKQETVKDLLRQARATEDKTIEIGLVAKLGYPDEVVTAVILAQLENSEDPDREVTLGDLLWAGAILDHLDTQGFSIRQKKIKKTKNG